MLKVRRAVAALAVALVAVGGLAAVEAPSASAAVDTTVLALAGTTGNPLMPPGTQFYTSPTSDFVGSPSETGASITMTQGAAVHRWTVMLYAPAGQELVAGTTYPDAQLTSFAIAGHPGIDLYGDGLACSAGTGSFTVLEFARDAVSQQVSQLAATFELLCQGFSVPVSGAVYFHSSLPYAQGASLTADGPASLPAGAGVTVQGALSDGTAPIGGAVLQVSRTDGSGKVALAPVTTAIDGSYSVVDTMPGSTASYAVDFAGSATVQALHASHSITMGAFPSTVTLGGPPTATRGVAYHVSGVLRSTDGPVVGATVTLTRSDLAGTRRTTVVTGATGAYSLRDVPAVGGPVHWSAAFAGEATHTSATATATVVVGRATANISIATSAMVYAYGAKAVVTAHLGTTYNGRTVYIYVSPYGSTVPAPGILIAHGTVNRSGTFAAAYRILGKATFTARFAGDYRYGAAARSVTRWVQGTVRARAVDYATTSSGYFVYRTSVGPIAATATPVRKFSCIYFALQRLSGTSWRPQSTSGCVIADGKGVAATNISYPTRGAKYRFRASVVKDGNSLGAVSPWVYVRFS